MYYFQSASLTVLDMKIFIDPGYQMVLKGTLDELVKEIG